ncbi:MFS transporter [Streptomyces sp. NPDC088253]|uniref:MFS transporter n=1 Tax=Streptomyces sp. NPDC088253 TaxID=3365846 RepID=UPI00382542A0
MSPLMSLRRLHDGLPPAFSRLWFASAVSSLGDGVYLVALPLFAVSLTPDPFALSLVTAASLLPWLLFGLLGGALVDRWDRRRTMWISDLARTALLSALVAATALGAVDLQLLIAVAFLLGIGQIFFDTASSAYLPQLLDRDLTSLRRANTLKQGAQTATNEFAGPPLGGLLFALGRAIPLAFDALSFLLSGLLIRTLPAQPVAPAKERRSLWSDAREGAAYVFGNRVLLGLALRFAVGNLAFAGGEAVLVLFAHRTLHIGNSGYGLLLATQAVGGLAGTALAGLLGARMKTGHALTVTAAVEAAAQLGLGVSSGPLTAGLAMAVCSAAMSATMVLVPSVSQAIVPAHLTGRVSATNRMLGVGAAPVGAVLGGWLATAAGLRAPFVAGAFVLAAMTVLVAVLTSADRIEAALEKARDETAPADLPAA